MKKTEKTVSKKIRRAIWFFINDICVFQDFLKNCHHSSNKTKKCGVVSCPHISGIIEALKEHNLVILMKDYKR